MGEGLGWGLNKTAQRQNPAFTSLGGFPSFAKRATLTRWAEAHPTQTQRLFRLAAFQCSQSGRHRPGGLKPTLRKPSVYLAWRLSIVREAGDADPVG